MAVTCTTGTVFVMTTPTTPTNARMRTYQNRMAGNSSEGWMDYFSYWGKVSVTEKGGAQGATNATSFAWDTNTAADLDADTDYLFKARIETDSGTDLDGVTKTHRTNAMVAVMVVEPAASAVTASTATIAATYIPRTVESTCSAQLQYKKTTDVDWTNAGAAATDGGYSNVAISRNITGLTGSTQYQMRLVITRTTNNDTSLTSTTTSFTTAAAAPTITTVAATSIGAISAVLNATVDPNSISTDVTFEWDTGTGEPYANETSPVQNFTGDGNQAASKSISGLTASTQYFFRAKAVHAGGTVYGTELNFTTAGDPSQEAKDEDMLPIQSFDRKYGVESTVYFVAPVIAATSSNSFYTGVGTIWDAAGESKVSKDGGAFSDTTNNPAQVSGALYSLVLTAAEMAADDIFVILSDGATAVRDVLIHVRTHLTLGSVDIDAATGTKADTTAFKVTGYGSGHGFSATAGATGQDINGILGEHSLHSGLVAAGTTGTTLRLASTAVATDDFYNGSIVLITSGTGIGQSRVIVDYALTNKEATINKTWVATPVTGDGYVIIPGNDLWEVSPAVELAALPTAASGFGKMLQFLFQRFAYKRTQTSNTHTMLKANSTDTFASAGVADSGGVQSFNKLA